MQVRETIELSGKPFPKPLPIQADIMVEFFAKNGFIFKHLDRTLLQNEIYSRDRISQLKKLLEAKGFDLEVDHSIWTEYEDEDFEQHPLWILLFPDIFIDEIDFEKTCKVCNKITICIDTNKKVPFIKSIKPIVAVNGQFTIVRKDLKKKMEIELIGSNFEPFDEKGEYFYLLSKRNLGELVNSSGDFIGYNGICSDCNLPIFKMFFGAQAYAKSNWNGDDIVSGAFHSSLFYTKKAYQLLKSVEKKVSRYGVAILK